MIQSKKMVKVAALFFLGIFLLSGCNNLSTTTKTIPTKYPEDIGTQDEQTKKAPAEVTLPDSGKLSLADAINYIYSGTWYYSNHEMIGGSWTRFTGTPGSGTISTLHQSMTEPEVFKYSIRDGLVAKVATDGSGGAEQMIRPVYLDSNIMIIEAETPEFKEDLVMARDPKKINELAIKYGHQSDYTDWTLLKSLYAAGKLDPANNLLP